MNLHLTKDDLNFGAILGRIGDSRRVMIATYGLGNPQSNPVLAALRALPSEAEVTVITNVPGRRAPSKNDKAAKTNKVTEGLITALDPTQFRCSVTGWFCFDNHAKVILCEDIAYVGSANSTSWSRRNFEAGYTTRDASELQSLREFLERMKSESIPYLNLQGSLRLQELLRFCGEITAVVSDFEERVSEWVVDPRSGDGDFVFSPDRLEVPTDLMNAVQDACEVAEILEASPNGQNEEKFAESGLTPRLRSLLEELETIANGSAVPPPFNETAVSASLVERYIGKTQNGKVDEVYALGDYQDDLERFRDSHTKERNDAAHDHYTEVRRMFTSLRGDLREALADLGVNPNVRAAPPWK